MTDTHLLTTEQVLRAYIRTKLKPLYGAGAYAINCNGVDMRDSSRGTVFVDAVAACPIGALCIDKQAEPCLIESGTLGDYYYNDENHDGNVCWTDGYVAAWEETDPGSGYDPEGFGYTEDCNPDGLALYKRGYDNGGDMRKDFIKLGMRSK